jgi:hypothetical protein
VIVNAFSAQYGRMAGAQVNYISKSGTNDFHGNLAENYNDAVLNANDCFKNLEGTPRGRAVANQYAASIGGPILRNKLTFFANAEGLRYALPSSGVVSLPSPELQQYTGSHPCGVRSSLSGSLQTLQWRPGHQPRCACHYRHGPSAGQHGSSGLRHAKVHRNLCKWIKWTAVRSECSLRGCLRHQCIEREYGKLCFRTGRLQH